MRNDLFAHHHWHGRIPDGPGNRLPCCGLPISVQRNTQEAQIKPIQSNHVNIPSINVLPDGERDRGGQG